jgi:chloramphenicol 3-O phosphotransferase
LVIVLSGASSSGKTTLAEALQRRLRAPAVRVEADRSFPDVPSDHPLWASLGRSHQDVVLAFHRSIASWAEAGLNVIVDGSLPYEDRDLRAACIGVFAPFDLRILGVRCAASELSRREAGRPEKRPDGWAVRQSTDIHDGMRYAAEVDTTARSSEECAEDAATQLGLPLIA